MGDRIVITSGKGGVGKSTIAVNLAAALAREDRTCCLVDMDMGLRSLDIFLGVENQVVFDLADVCEGVCRLKQALVKWPVSSRVQLLAAAQLRGSAALDETAIDEVTTELARRFDCVLIDCPAGVGRGFLNATAAVDKAVLVATPDPVSLRDAQRVAGLIRARDIPSQSLILNRVLPEHMEEDYPAGPQAFEARLEIPLRGLVPEDDRLAACMAVGAPPAWDASSPAGRAVRAAVARLNGQEIPFREVRKPGFFRRVERALRGRR